MSAQSLNKSIRLSILNLKVTPVLCSSSFKKDISVQSLLDAIRGYLPSLLEARVPVLKDTNHLNKMIPFDLESRKGLVINNDNNLCMTLVFKIITYSICGIIFFF